jgi:hypothetical protein
MECRHHGIAEIIDEHSVYGEDMSSIVHWHRDYPRVDCFNIHYYLIASPYGGIDNYPDVLI